MGKATNVPRHDGEYCATKWKSVANGPRVSWTTLSFDGGDSSKEFFQMVQTDWHLAMARPA